VSMYVDIDDTKQWINIYGENINNPVLMGRTIRPAIRINMVTGTLI
jgi:hypothetical protein